MAGRERLQNAWGRWRESCELGESSEKVRDPWWGSQDGGLGGLCGGWGELGRIVLGRIRLTTTCLHEEGWECVGSGRGHGETLPGQSF